MQFDFRKGGVVLHSLSIKGEGEYCIGRAEDNEVVLDSRALSRKHLKIVVDGEGRVFVTDLGSRNGTVFKGQKVTNFEWVSHKDVVYIGDVYVTRSPAAESGDDLNYEQQFSPSNNHDRPLVHSGNSKLKNKKLLGTDRFKGILPRVTCIFSLSLPFVFFALLGNSISDAYFWRVVSVASVKADNIWEVDKAKQLGALVEKAEQYLNKGNFKSCEATINNVLAKDKNNKRALSLQVKLAEKISLKEREREEKRNAIEEAKKVAEEAEKKEAEAAGTSSSDDSAGLIAEYLQTVQSDIAQKKYGDCLVNAGKVTAIDANNQQALEAIQFCQQELEIASVNIQVQEDLKKILEEGSALLEEQSFNQALEVLSEGLQLDPEKKYEISTEIDKQIEAVEKAIEAKLDEYKQLAEQEKKKGNYSKALQYCSSAAELVPDNKEIEKLTEEIKTIKAKQIKKNNKLAKEYYNEAVAYASLGNTSEAKKLLVKAKKLVRGDKELSAKIKDKIKFLQER